jgi:hypothetical protein
MIAKLYRYSLDAMENWFAHKIYVRAFTELYDMSPYENIDDHDRWQDHQEYIASQSEDYDYE